MKKVKINDKWLVIKNYKEPLLEIPKEVGCGYYGALLCTKDGKLVQCHLCGELFKYLPGHIYYHHGVRSKDYRKKFELAKSTALLSEVEREKRRIFGLKIWNSRSDKWKKEFFKKIKATDHKKVMFGISLETRNKRGACPNQLLEHIKTCAKAIGHTPTREEFEKFNGSKRYVQTIYNVFGSWTDAIKMAKLIPEQFKSNGNRRAYTKEQLLAYLVNFVKQHNRIPSYTDFKRGHLPSTGVYYKHFGGVVKARQLAGLNKKIK